jgi:hypothetical protein
MLSLLEQTVKDALERTFHLFITRAPGIVACLLILLISVAIAAATRWLLARFFVGISLDRLLSKGRLTVVLDRAGRVSVSSLLVETCFWTIIVIGTFAAISSVDARLPSRIIDGVAFLAPKLLVAGIIVLAGIWLGVYLGRSVLIWAVNHGIPGPRTLAAAVRMFFVSFGVVAASDRLDFARNAFLSAFVLLLSGVVLAAGLAFGLAGRDIVRRQLLGNTAHDHEGKNRSLWTHLQ